jgi:hypothetical protein
MVFTKASFAQSSRTSYRSEVIDTSCSPDNPRYCRECKDIARRDCARCGEIDYRKRDLLKSGLLPDSPPYLPPDRESGTGRVVFAVNIADKGLKSEIFILDSGDPAGTQIRLTWDADASLVNLDPFFTVDKKIAYTGVDTVNKTENYFLIEDIQSGKKSKISREQSDALYLAAHAKTGK